MRKKKLECNVVLKEAQHYVKELEAEVKKLNEEYRWKLVELKDDLGHCEDGYVNKIVVDFVESDSWFKDDKCRLCIIWNWSPLVRSCGGSFVSHQSHNFYNPTEIKLVDDWQKIGNIHD